MIKFKFCGIFFRISFLIIWFLVLILLNYGKYVFLSCIFAVSFHEFFHLLLIFCFHAKPRKIEFNVGGLTIVSGVELPFWPNIAVLSAGVLGNFLLFLIFIFFNFRFFAFVNLGLAILNILPYEKLDGGQLLELVLQKKFDLAISYRIIRISSFCVLIILSILGLILCVSFQNFTMLVVVFMLYFSS